MYFDVDKLSYAMRQRRVSPADLAQRSGYSASFIRRILNRTARPTASVIADISAVLETSLALEKRDDGKVFAWDADELRNLLEKANMSVTELAHRLGVRRSIVRHWTFDGVPERFGQAVMRSLSQRYSLSDSFVTSDQTTASAKTAEAFGYVVDSMADLVAHLHREPESIYRLPPRKFEELVAELVADMGFDVQLTPPSHDKGRDVLAGVKTPLGEILAIIECKRYHREHRIGPDIVERFLWTIDNRDRASFGVIASTSFFTSGAVSLEDEYHWKLMLRDFDALSTWISEYGCWTQTNGNKLWLPKHLGARDA